MNPLSSKLEERRFPPMSEVKKNLKIDWYRCPIDRKDLAKLIVRSDGQALIQAGGHLALWLLTASLSVYFFSHAMWLAFFVCLFLHGTIASFFTAPNHELCHRTVFKTQWLNDGFLIVFCLLGWLNFRVYRFSHNYHHRYTLFLEGDREEILPVTPSLRFLYIVQLFTINVFGGYQSRGIIPTVGNFLKLASNDTNNPFNSWGPELYEGHDKQRRKAVSWARTVLGFHAGVVVFSLAISQPVLIVVISGAPFIANWHRYFVGVTMHCGLRSHVSDFRKCARSVVLDPVSEFLYWRMNWHLEHHMYAAVPCYNLKKLHRVLADDMPKPRTLVGAWQEMRDTWHRQKTDPDYAFDTPVPAPKDGYAMNANDPLASSVGDLVNREMAEK